MSDSVELEKLLRELRFLCENTVDIWPCEAGETIERLRAERNLARTEAALITGENKRLRADLQTFDEMCSHYGKLSDQFFEQKARIEELEAVLEKINDATQRRSFEAALEYNGLLADVRRVVSNE